MTSSQNKILFIGAAMLDYRCGTSDYDKLKTNLGTLPHSLGGCAVNSCIAARSAGAEADLFVPIGKGPVADTLTVDLKVHGLNGYVVETQLDNGYVLCLIDNTGDRDMITTPGIEKHFQSDWFNNIDADKYKFIATCGYEVACADGEAIIALMENHPECQAVFAPGPVISQLPAKTITRFNKMHAIWHLNRTEALAYTQCDDLITAGKTIQSQNHNLVLITDGKHGAYGFKDNDVIYAKAEPIDIVNTVGAGDAHLGAMLARMSLGDSLDDALKQANHISALVCQQESALLPHIIIQ